MHLINALKEDYEIETDWNGELYCGITLKWNYDEKYVDTKMPGYTMKQIKKYKHKLKKQQHTPLQPQPRKYGKAAQEPTPPDTSKLLGKEDKKLIEQVVGSFLFYGRAVDPIILHSLNTIAIEQNQPTKNTMKKLNNSLITCTCIQMQSFAITRPTWF